MPHSAQDVLGTSLSIAPALGTSAAVLVEEWGPLVELPCALTLELPVPAFTVRDLLRLDKETIIDTRWSQSRDIPLSANGELIAWSEFEVVGERLAVRLTELA